MGVPAPLLAAALAAALAVPGACAQAGGGEPPAEAPHGALPSADELAALPPDGGDEFNRLVFEKSPYLLQHARNPVDWYPWGEAAFARARAEDKPIFLSVGYSTCHWCHVMERESFEDDEVAALLNRHFVPVKVDREERPDVDATYMAVVQATTGRGGWPMTVVLTPDGQPFFAGTYFPARGRFGRAGLVGILERLAELWDERRADLVADARRITDAVAELSAGTPGEVPGEALHAAYRALAAAYDPEHGGFGRAPKFPVASELRFLLRYADRFAEPRAAEIVVETLRGLRRGGIWDQLGHGFHRYATDRAWLVPHFEKMLYDQALLTMALVEAWQLTGDAELRAIAEDVLAYVLRDMTAPSGAFWSAEDADSEGEEGLFYLWTPEELEEVLGPDDAALAAAWWGVREGGNYRDEASGERTGRSILHRPRELAELAAERDVEPDALRARIEGLRARLFEARERRVHPRKDDKVLTDWNGLTIAAFAQAGRAFGEERYVEAARRAADFVLRELRAEDGGLRKRWRDGEAALPAVLDDYAYLVWGLVELYQADGAPRWLRTALELSEEMLARFGDPEGGGLYLSPAPAEGEAGGPELIYRPREGYDGALPSGNAVAAWSLLRLARLTGETRLEERAEELFRAFGGDVARSPRGHTQLLVALDLALGPAHEVVLVGAPDAPDTEALRRALATVFAPRAVVLHRPPGPAPEIAELAPFTAPQRALDGRATAYVCTGFACRAPTTDAEAMLAALRADQPRERAADD